MRVRVKHTNTEARYCLYYPDEGRYSVLMTLAQARALLRQFTEAYIVNAETAEVIYD